MDKTLEKVITKNEKGLFLLDSPTGFGKTTAVLNIIKRFLNGDCYFSNIKRIFFVTNLLTNLPYNKLLESLDDDKKKQCFIAKATIDYILERFPTVEISDKEVVNSKEYKNLHKDIESYQFQSTLLNEENTKEYKLGYINSLKILKQKIATESEPAFRKYLKNRFIYNKTVQERNNFIDQNSWFTKLYPICDIEKYKVIFLSTKKFISPMDTFRRMPFYAYCDDKLMKNSIVFIDEFDSTKQEFLDQIIEDGYKSETDIVSLFLSMHYALQNLVLPKKILCTSDYHKDKVENNEWYTTKDHFKYWRKQFEEKYIKYNINYLMKTVDFNSNKAFLFDDGKYFTIVKDSSKKYIYASLDKNEDILSLKGLTTLCKNGILINCLIRDLEYCIDGFAQALFYVANNFLYYKNQNKQSNETKYTLEEALYTVLDILNISDVEKDYLFSKIQTENYSFKKQESEEVMRKGFNFTEIEDSNYHDMKSVVHNFSFPTTPEDALIKLASRSLVIGISATAKIDTCVGNYDLSYLADKLVNNYIEIESEDENRINKSFQEMIDETKGKYKIHTYIIDDGFFSKKEQCEKLIKILFKDELCKIYLKNIDNLNDKELYYFNIELKLAYFYKEVVDKKIKSAIAFINKFPKNNDIFNLTKLKDIFSKIYTIYDRQDVYCKIVNSQNFDYEFEDAKKLLNQGKQVLLITTYKTVGSGKNMQYPIPNDDENQMIYAKNDNSGLKDFEAIYVCTPTHLVQHLSYDSEDKYNDLAKFLFQQEYLYKKKYLTYSQMKSNIERGFRHVFFGEKRFRVYTSNDDLYFHTIKIIIQAIGRICRCRSKNKNIYIYTDKELLINIKTAYELKQPKMMNEEFRELLFTKIDDSILDSKINEYSSLNKNAYCKITNDAFNVRNSKENVEKWQKIREYVLKNPTADKIDSEYFNLYFKMGNKVSGYSYKQNKSYDIVEMYMQPRLGYSQVSDQSCDLPFILSISYVREMFNNESYAKSFKKHKYIMSPSLYKQVYLGALGEVVGKCILENELGLKLEDLDDYSFYEYFDFKIGNIYFDFKHWNEFFIDNNKYVKKIESKLEKIKGTKCFAINLVKRNDAQIKQNIEETVVQVPYLIDGETMTINEDFIKKIQSLI